MVFALSTFLAASAVAFSMAAPPCRDRWLEPFTSESIWNTAIGDGAQFVPAGLFQNASTFPSSFHNDQDWLLRASEADPLTPWIDQGDWGADDHCVHQANAVVRTAIPLPTTWTTASDCDGPADNSSSNCVSKANQSNNNAMALLFPDNETLLQMQPVYRCGFGSPLFARWGNDTDGCPQNFPNVTSIFGDGRLGAHGGSGLSSIGGTIRLTELLPSSPPINHALKLELNNFWYYGASQLQPKTPRVGGNGGNCQYVWPATGSNAGFPTTAYLGTNKFLAPGSLLALPADVAAVLNTTTEVGSRVKAALTDYGGYIVDGTGGAQQPIEHQTVAVCMDAHVNAEMRATYGYAMTYPTGVPKGASAADGGEVYNDLLTIFQHLHIVTNNSPTSVGGGGTPRRPPKPPICGAPTHP